jgi:two-component system cell cycle response regulator DivK
MENKGKILHVEDNPDNRLLVRRVLQAAGYTVLEAGDAREALDVLRLQTPDLILMDINLPEIDGYTLTGQLKARPELAHVPIIAMTAYALRGDRERSLAAGCDEYIEKPIDVDSLSKQIDRFLKQSAGQCQPKKR